MDCKHIECYCLLQGSQFDKNGNLLDWWQPEAKRVFRNKTNCVVEQYNGYKEPTTGLSLNGINVQGESIADIAGLKEAFMAYSN